MSACRRPANDVTERRERQRHFLLPPPTKNIFSSQVAGEEEMALLDKAELSEDAVLGVGVQAQKTRLKLNALLSLSQSNFETGCYQARVEPEP